MILAIRKLMLSLVIVTLGGCHSKPYEGKTIAELQRMLEDPSPAVQAQGAFGLSQMGSEAREAVPALIESLKRESLVRQNAALALGAIGPEASDAVPALIELLHDPEWTVRRQAATALGKIGPAGLQALPELRKLKQDSDNLVRKAAVEAISRIRDASH
jgi:HEAT repeat protein